MTVFKLQPINLKNSGAQTEKWVQDQIVEDPSILGLGEDLELKDKEDWTYFFRNL